MIAIAVVVSAVMELVDTSAVIRRPKTAIDYWGMGLLAIGIAALQIVFDRGQEADWFHSHFIVTMTVVVVIGLVSFTIWELRASNAVVHFRLFRYREHACPSCCFSRCMAALCCCRSSCRTC
jgi:DHA2 family multidrug resistance protein